MYDDYVLFVSCTYTPHMRTRALPACARYEWADFRATACLYLRDRETLSVPHSTSSSAARQRCSVLGAVAPPGSRPGREDEAHGLLDRLGPGHPRAELTELP